MRVLLLGSRGMLAHDLIAAAPDHVALTAPPEEDLNITVSDDVRAALREVRPDVVINAAAYTDVDGAERNRETAYRINAEAVDLVAQNVRGFAPAALIVHFSTDYVFSGATAVPYAENHTTNPLGTYGASKLAGEHALAKNAVRFLIIRTQWLFGLHGRSFPRTMWERAGQGVATRVVHDQIGRPTYTADLAEAVWRLLAHHVSSAGGTIPEVLHLANSGQASWYELAHRVFSTVGATELLSPCTTAEYPTPARRPPWSVLNTQCAERILGSPLPRWEHAIDRFLAHLLRRAGSTPAPEPK